jgi:hypothetical protein
MADDFQALPPLQPPAPLPPCEDRCAEVSFKKPASDESHRIIITAIVVGLLLLALVWNVLVLY